MDMTKQYNSNQKYYRVFSRWLADALVNSGFKPVRREMNHKTFGYYVYIFENTPEFYNKFVELSTNKETK